MGKRSFNPYLQTMSSGSGNLDMIFSNRSNIQIRTAKKLLSDFSIQCHVTDYILNLDHTGMT